jgi:predicted CDP-diglyceride synthetase/phosphatidate cytidylyltransferase
VTRRVISRLFFSFVIAVTILLIVATSIAVLIGLIRGPHEAAQDVETTIGAYWPLILVSVSVLTAGLAAVPRDAVAT